MRLADTACDMGYGIPRGLTGEPANESGSLSATVDRPDTQTPWEHRGVLLSENRDLA